MRLFRVMAAFVASFALASCGGGKATANNDSGGNSGDSSAIAISLQDSNGATVAPPSLTGSQNAFVVVTVKTADGGAAANKLVSVSGAGFTFTPASGQVLTDSAGVAKVQVRQLDPFASGASTLTATSGTNSATLDVALGSASASLGTLTASAISVDAYQTTQVSVPVTVTGTATPAVQLPVTFSASCGIFDPTSAVSGSDGVAQSTYRNQNGTTACAGTVTLSAKVGTSTATTQVTANSPVAANIKFIDAQPQRIYLAGSPGVGQSIVSFKLVDSSGNAVVGQSIDLTLTLRPTGTYLGSTPGTTGVTQSTDSNGQVAVSVNAGSAPGPVQVKAALTAQPTLANVSNTLTIASGLPVQKAFSFSASPHNIEGLDYDGVPSVLTIYAADRLGNPVPDGTTINFITSGGQVQASCNTAIVNGVSTCDVTLVSQSPRPANFHVLAWAQGEETFTDAGTPTNNVFDNGEAFEDLGQPFLDVNLNATYDPGVDITVGTASGNSSCVADVASHRSVGVLSVPDTCDQAWGQALVRAEQPFVFSGSKAFVGDVVFTQASATTCAVSFTLTDRNGNPMPKGTSLAVGSAVGGSVGTMGGNGATVQDTVVPTTHIANFTACPAVGSLTFQLTVTTPKGNVTVIPFPQS